MRDVSVLRPAAAFRWRWPQTWATYYTHPAGSHEGCPAAVWLAGACRTPYFRRRHGAV